MRTGVTAFRLSMGKALVPFAFVYTPAMLFVDFSWYTGFFGRKIHRPAFVVLNVLSLSLVFGNPIVTAVAAPLVLFTLYWHWRGAEHDIPLGAIR
jgi:TRAP-type uncharacterized transport system fused permease subunit